MHQVIEDGGEVLVQHLREDEFPIHSPDTPENYSNKHSNGKCCRSEYEVPDAAETLDDVGEESDGEEDEL